MKKRESTVGRLICVLCFIYALMRLDYSHALKRRRFTTFHLMAAESAKVKLAAAKEKYGRDLRIFETSVPAQTPNDVSSTDDSDDFYEFTAEDYYRVLSTKKQDKYLKTRKIREAEEAALRSRITKAVIRVRFPDNHTVEATFHPSEKIQSLVDLLMKVAARPKLPFYIYTTPPKKQIKDMSQDFFSAGFVPGAIVYFAYDLPKGDDGGATSGPFLQEEVLSLKDLEIIAEQVEPEQPESEPRMETPTVAAVQERKSADKKAAKPKWFKM